MHSPYLTNPLNKYPKEVFTMSSKLKELKSAGDFIYDVNYIVVFDEMMIKLMMMTMMIFRCYYYILAMIQLSPLFTSLLYVTHCFLI